MRTISFFNPISDVGKTTLTIKFYDYLTSKRLKVKGFDCSQGKEFARTYSLKNSEEHNVQPIAPEDLKFFIEMTAPGYDYILVDLPTTKTSLINDHFFDYIFVPIIPELNHPSYSHLFEAIKLTAKTGIYLLFNRVSSNNMNNIRAIENDLLLKLPRSITVFQNFIMDQPIALRPQNCFNEILQKISE